MTITVTLTDNITKTFDGVYKISEEDNGKLIYIHWVSSCTGLERLAFLKSVIKSFTYGI